MDVNAYFFGKLDLGKRNLPVLRTQAGRPANIADSIVIVRQITLLAQVTRQQFGENQERSTK
jgi:hypothetical protein